MKDNFSDLFSEDSQGCHNESTSKWTTDEFGIKVSLKSELRKNYVQEIPNGQRHGIKRARRINKKACLIEQMKHFQYGTIVEGKRK